MKAFTVLTIGYIILLIAFVSLCFAYKNKLQQAESYIQYLERKAVK